MSRTTAASVLVSALVFIFPVFADEGKSHEAHQAMTESMNKMHQEMSSMSSNGDPDKDFVSMMMKHHQSGIEMAEIELKHGKDLKTKQFAQKMIKEQKKDLAELQAMAKSNR